MSFSLYPNPTKGQLNIQVTNMPSDAHGEITLYDLNGRLLIKQNSLRENYLLDISTQPIGVYVLRIEACDMVKEWKVIKE